MNVAAAQARARGRRRVRTRRRRTSRASSPAPRADQPHGVDFAGRQRSRLPQRQLRRAARGLQGAGARADRRRRRHHPDRNDLRHAERQGGGLRDARGVRREGPRAADHDFRHDHGSLRAHAVGPDGGSLLVLDAPPAAVLDRIELRARRRADAALSSTSSPHVADTRIIGYPNAGLPNAMGEYDESPDEMACQSSVARRTVAQHRRRLLRHDARAHRAHRRATPKHIQPRKFATIEPRCASPASNHLYTGRKCQKARTKI